MKRTLILSAVAAVLGLSAFAAPTAHADSFRIIVGDRDRYEDRDFDRACDDRDVPRRVLDRAYDLGNGRRIQWIRHVSRHGRTYYLVHMDARGKVDLDLRITPDGRVLDVDRDPDNNGH